MVKAYKLHKVLGLSAGIFILLLSVSGFFLDHKKWDFLYTTTFSSVPSHIKSNERDLFNSYHVDLSNKNHIITGGYRGLFESFDSGKHFEKVSNLQILNIIEFENKIYLATSNGVYIYKNKVLKEVGLLNKYITGLSISKDYIVAVVDKCKIITINRNSSKIVSSNSVNISKNQLFEDITLSRLIRDLHYGRGLFDDDTSLFLNDYATVWLTFLVFSGFLIWYFINKKKRAKVVKRVIKTHSNIFSIIAIFFILILSITGIFLDHASSLAFFTKNTTIKHNFLPSIYNSLKRDIWSIDYFNHTYRIGNRYGVFKSDDLKSWKLENQGFAYRMIRRGKTLYISGMGAPNRVFQNKHYSLLPNTPHMFRDIILKENNIVFFSKKNQNVKLPIFQDVTLFTLLLTIHDGTFFSSWWIWINDISAIFIIVILFTGLIRWWKRKINKKLTHT